MRLVSLAGHNSPHGRSNASTAICLTIILLTLTTLAKAQSTNGTGGTDSWNADWVSDMVGHAFFHITVEGTPSDASVTTPHQGKAFAIGPHLLATSQHIVGDANEWKPKEADNGTPLAPEVKRAMRPVDRRIELKGNSDLNPGEFSDVIVLPTPYALDTVGLLLPNKTLERFFRLSLCEIVEHGTYGAIMTTAENPADPRSITNAKLIQLEAKGYDPLQYGPLYVFERKGGADFHGETEGHDGSPIFDADRNVVAIVSAVTAKKGSGEPLILATPIQPLFPAASVLMARAIDLGTDGSLRCSLSDTVRQLNEEVSAHAIWDVNPAYDDDGVLKDLHLDYDSMTEKPNVESIVFEYKFLGKQDRALPFSTLTYPDNTPNFNIELKPSTERDHEREFALTQMVDEGRQVEKLLKDLNTGGYIDYVQVTVYKTRVVGNRTSTKVQTFNIDWKKR